MVRFNHPQIGMTEFYEVDDLSADDYVIKSDITKRKKYYNEINTFDIETTTYNKELAFMYIFMLYYNGKAVCGRTWLDFIKFVNNVKKYNKNGIVVFYVFFLSFEFQFMKDFFNWDSVFAIDSHKVIKAVTDNIEFRCAYYLTNMSLEKFVENSKTAELKKLKGDFDYSVIRYPNTKLTDMEYAYCYNDVYSFKTALEEKFEEDNMETIPVTSTGYVRRYCRSAMRKNKKNRELFLKTSLNKKTYILLKEAMRGGNTHGNRLHIGCIMHDVKGFDIRSAYPFVMICCYFPMTRFTPIKVKDKFDYYINKYCCLFRVHFEGLELRNDKEIPVPYISYHKCWKHSGQVLFNGRVISADIISTTITELDWNIIKEQYTWKRVAVSDFHIAERGELPKELKGCIMEFYFNKTTLKKENPYLYMKSKNLLNSIFGMACTDPVRQEILIDTLTGIWSKQELDIENSLSNFYKNRNSFLPFQWGVWVTAQAREHLQKMIRVLGDNTIYCDTDSDYAVGVDENVLDELNEQVKKLAEEKGAYVDFNGKRYHLGIFEHDKEDCFDRFITLGAKKYAYEQNGKLKITVSGVNKQEGGKELKKLENFKSGFVFKVAGGTTHYYNNISAHYMTMNGITFLTGSNVAVTDSTYTLGYTNEVLEKILLNIMFENFAESC